MEKEKDIGGVWKRLTKNGDEFLSFKIGDKSYVAWKNRYKNNPKSPDFRIFESKPRELAQEPTTESNDIAF